VTVDVDASRVTDVANYGGFIVSLPDDASVISSSNLSDSAFRGYEFGPPAALFALVAGGLLAYRGRD